MWKDYIEELKSKWIGKKVKYDREVYTIVDVDYNGVLHIDKPTQYNKTMAVYSPFEAQNHVVESGEEKSIDECITDSERKEFCDNCGDFCSNHCVIWRKAQMRKEAI